MPGPQPFAIKDPEVTHVIVELFGGDNNLSAFVEEDLYEMAAGNRGPFAVLALADYADAGATVIEWTPRTGRHEVERLGEIDTGDPETLAEFVARALVTYPAGVKLAIGFWDHGSGVFDEYDPNELLLERRAGRYPAVPRHRRPRSFRARHLLLGAWRRSAEVRARAMLHDDTNAGVLTNLEAGRMLAAAFARAGRTAKVELLFSDTCLNGMVEVTEQLRPFAEVVVASEDLEPGDGWEYHEWLARMSDAPPADAGAWGRQAVEGFEAGYRDRPGEHPCTLAAFRAENRIATAFKGFVEAARSLGRPGFDRLQRARALAQSFAGSYDSYDLEHFMQLIGRQRGAPALRAAAAEVVAATAEARVASTALGPTVRRATGLAFWFPSTRRELEEAIGTYRRLAFAERTGWADYLEARYG
jgi:hypothetical protein